MRESSDNLPTRSKVLYHRISKWMYLLGAPNYFHEDLETPKFFNKIHDKVMVVIDIVAWVFLVSLIGSFFTQHNLNENQKADRAIFAFTIPLYYIFVPTITHYQEKVRDVVYNLIVKMKDTYNDPEVENQMIKQAKMYLFSYGSLSSSTLFLYGINGVLQVATKGATFVTLITAWPDVDDTSTAAGVMRVIIYIITVIRIHSVAYVVAILMVVILSHQYKNLGSYFHSLSNIFAKENLSQEEKEKEYEEAFKVGVQMHSNTLKCTKLTQEICNVVYSGQLMVNITILILLLVQMVVNPDRSFSNMATICIFGLCTLFSTGIFWWNAGNTTVEASELSTAMFHSGWHHCRKEAARRIRPIIVISMCHSQVPVELHCLGIVTLSYQSYVSVAKSSYSVFSVLY